MTDIWTGGEDTSFPLGAGGTLDTSQAAMGGSRYSMGLVGAGYRQTLPFTSPFTGGWFHFSTGVNYAYIDAAGIHCLGLVDALASQKGIWAGEGSAEGKLALYKYDGSTWTKLVEESGTSLSGGAHDVDFYLSDLGATATVKGYVASNLVIDTTLDLSISGVTSLNHVRMNQCPSNLGQTYAFANIIVSTTSTLGRYLKTIVFDGAGDVNEMDAGTYADLIETAINDATQIYTAMADKKFLGACTGMPAGDWVVKSLKIEARCVDGLGTLGGRLGIKSGGTENFESTPQVCTGYWQTLERLMPVNPVTDEPFTSAEIDAPIQVGIESGTV